MEIILWTVLRKDLSDKNRRQEKTEKMMDMSLTIDYPNLCTLWYILYRKGRESVITKQIINKNFVIGFNQLCVHTRLLLKRFQNLYNWCLKMGLGVKKNHTEPTFTFPVSVTYFDGPSPAFEPCSCWCWRSKPNRSWFKPSPVGLSFCAGLAFELGSDGLVSLSRSLKNKNHA